MKRGDKGRKGAPLARGIRWGQIHGSIRVVTPHLFGRVFRGQKKKIGGWSRWTSSLMGQHVLRKEVKNREKAQLCVGGGGGRKRVYERWCRISL